MVGIFKRATEGTAAQTAVFFMLALFLLGGTAAAATFSIGYTSTTKFPNGTLVSSDIENNGSVVPSNSNSASSIVGVVVDDSAAVVSDGMVDKVDVSSDGTASILVSDINGKPVNGSKVSASPLDGIGMITTVAGKIVGTLQGDLTADSPGAQYKTVTDKAGKEKKVLIGLVPIGINVTYYQPPDTASRLVPEFLRELTNTIGGKEVSPARIWGSLTVVMAGLAIVTVLVYGAVRSSIGAIGRNPLARSAIQWSLSKVIILAAVILAATGTIVYLILRG